ncbi:hypothetical protein B0H11DRAFT_1943990 [Mycena galericulata]|nr:hypothetical protein B0H11DRAFT_1943990 [Mycena galericulata]
MAEFQAAQPLSQLGKLLPLACRLRSRPLAARTPHPLSMGLHLGRNQPLALLVHIRKREAFRKTPRLRRGHCGKAGPPRALSGAAGAVLCHWASVRHQEIPAGEPPGISGKAYVCG